MLRIRTAESAPQGLTPYAPVDDGSQGDLLRARTRLLRLYRSLEALAESANVRTRLTLDLPDAVSNSGLGEPRGEPIAAQKSADGIVGEVHRWASPDLLGSEGLNGPRRECGG